MPVKKCFCVLVRKHKSVENTPGRQRRRQGQVSARNALGHTHKIRPHPLVLTREHLSRTAKSGRHLVDDKKNIIFAAKLFKTPEHALRMHDHAGRALDKRLKDDRRDLAMLFL